MGGKAIKSAKALFAKTAQAFADCIISKLKGEGFSTCAVGSIGKKEDFEMSSDIDIAIKAPFDDETIVELKSILQKLFYAEEFKLSKGFKILHAGLPYKKSGEKHIAQVDFMFCNNLSNAAFLWHSPDYKAKESKFKGASRTDLMRSIVVCTPVPKQYDKEDFFSNGDVKSWWHFSLSQLGELELKHKTLEGSRDPSRPLKNPKTIKEDTIVYAKDVDSIVSTVFGDKCSVDKDLNSFESEIEFLLSPQYKYGEDPDFIKMELESFINNFGDLEENALAVKVCRKIIRLFDKGLDCEDIRNSSSFKNIFEV